MKTRLLSLAYTLFALSALGQIPAASLSLGDSRIFTFPATSGTFAPQADSRWMGAVTPQMYGAVGDGLNHPITAVQLAAITDLRGTYAVGDERDYVALQEMVYHATCAVGTTPNSGAYCTLNHPMLIPLGNYLVNKTVVLTDVWGASIQGGGRLATTITSYNAGPVFDCEILLYSHISGIKFAAQADNPSGVFVVNGVGSQACHFEECFFDANQHAMYAFAIATTGTSGTQGSEMLFSNCHYEAAKSAGVYINSYNALGLKFNGGDVGGCVNGFYVYSGSISLDTIDFEVGDLRKQIESNGYDVVLVNGSASSTILNCRSEGAKFLRVGNQHVVFYANNTCAVKAPNLAWASGHPYNQGDIVSGTTAGTGDGFFQIALNSGTTGSTEPTWNESTEQDRIDAGTNQNAHVTNGSTTINVSTPFYPGTAEGNGIIVYGAGVGGSNLYTTLVSAATPRSFNSWTMAEASHATISDVSYVYGPKVTDGTVNWMRYSYNEIKGYSSCTIINYQGGSGRTTLEQATVINSTFGNHSFPTINNIFSGTSIGNVISLNAGDRLSGRTYTQLPTVLQTLGSLSVGGTATFGSGVGMSGLPTSASGLASGQLWRNGSVVNIVP